MLILQLELADSLFTLDHPSESNCEILQFGEFRVAKRNEVDAFLKEIAKHYRIAVWSVYPKELTEQLAEYLASIGIHLEYVCSREDCTQFGMTNSKLEKRLKKLNHKGFEPTEIVSLEIEKPIHEDYHNYYILEKFSGQWDSALLDQLPELISLSKVQNTNLIH